ncbi:hypothetical protein PG993_011839 [Apiospora rasikravindrae]|uniref:Uncharacterized protein n=1 Tax=Apiospora rasikravindrae TaxID=990691 RepID=A0ABR1S0X0_9PEZI
MASWTIFTIRFALRISLVEDAVGISDNLAPIGTMQTCLIIRQRQPDQQVAVVRCQIQSSLAS